MKRISLPLRNIVILVVLSHGTERGIQTKIEPKYKLIICLSPKRERLFFLTDRKMNKTMYRHIIVINILLVVLQR